jgi:OOP family OmpA-OmpF porin
MKKVTKASLVLASTLAVTATVAHAQSTSQKNIQGDPKRSGYVLDQRGTVVRDPFGLCWRSGYFTPAMALAECDPDLVPKAPPPPPPPPPPPAPAVVAPAPVAPPPPPPPPAAPVSEKVTFAADAFFDTGKSVLKPDARAKLDDLASKVKDISLEVIIAVGHTDNVGGDALNQRLSVARAESVKAYLVSKGIDASRVYTEGKGKTSPVADNKTADGRAKNRRTEIEVVGTRPVRR